MRNKLNRVTAIFLSFILLLSASPLSALAGVLAIPSGDVQLPKVRTYEFYAADGRTLLAKQQVLNGSWLRVPQAPAAVEGKPFIGWFTQKTGGERFESFGKQSGIDTISTIELYAQHEALCTVVFKHMHYDAEYIYKVQQVRAGTQIELENKIGYYNIDGWKLEGTDDLELLSSPLTVQGDMTLMAVSFFDAYASDYRVYYAAGEGSGPAPIDDNLYSNGDLKTAILKGPGALVGPVAKPYFIGWRSGRAGDARLYQPGDSVRPGTNYYPLDTTYTAQWSSEPDRTTDTLGKTTITYHNNTGISALDKTHVVSDIDINKVYMLPTADSMGFGIAGETFYGWSTDPATKYYASTETGNAPRLEAGQEVFIDEQGINNLYAVWKKYGYTLQPYHPLPADSTETSNHTEEGINYKKYGEPIKIELPIKIVEEATPEVGELNQYLGEYLDRFAVKKIIVTKNNTTEPVKVLLKDKAGGFDFKVHHILRKYGKEYDLKNPHHTETFTNKRIGDTVNATVLTEPGYTLAPTSVTQNIPVSYDAAYVYYEDTYTTVRGLIHWTNDNDGAIQMGEPGYQAINDARPNAMGLKVERQYHYFFPWERIMPEISWNKNYATDTWEYSFTTDKYKTFTDPSWKQERTEAYSFRITQEGIHGYGQLKAFERNSTGGTDFTNKKLVGGVKLVVEKTADLKWGREPTLPFYRGRFMPRSQYSTFCLIKVRNEGTVELTDVNVVDSNFDLNTIAKWNKNTGDDNILSPGEEWTYYYEYIITMDDYTRTFVKNTVTVNAKANGEDLPPQSASTTTWSDQITIKPKDLSKVYDGTPLNAPGEVEIMMLPKGWTATVKTSGSQTEAGKGESKVDSVVIKDPRGRYATQFFKITLLPGDLTVEKIDITAQPKDVSKVYDGTPLTPTDVEITGLPKGYTVETKFDGSQTNAGEGKSKVASIIVRDAEGRDVTAHCNIKLNPGTLKVAKRPITIASKSVTKTYDGTVLTAKEVTIGGEGLARGEEFIYTFTGARKNIGTSKNTFTIEAKAGTLLANYEIVQEYGLLQVLPKLSDYRVEYYVNGTLNPEMTEILSGEVGATIRTYPNKIKGGFRVEREENLPLTLTENAAQNVIRVYYAKKPRMELIIDTPVPLAGNMAALNVGDCLE